MSEMQASIMGDLAKKPGLMVEIHGPQGSGKTTALNLIEDALHSAGYMTTTHGDAHVLSLRPPAPVPPIQAPETPDALATRLSADPETLAAVILEIARRSSALDRAALHDEIQKQDCGFRARSAGLRLLAATIAAGSFGK